MAKRVTAADAQRGSNGYDSDELKALIGQIESFHGDLESEKGSYMRRCKDIRDGIDEVYAEAKNKGISKKALKTHIDLRKLEARKAVLVGKLEDGDGDSFDKMAEALGDFAKLPLGAAAMARADQGGESLSGMVN